MALPPLGRTDEPLFLRIPAADNDGPLRFPSGLQHFAEPVHRLEHRGGPAVRIDGAIHPRVAVVPCGDPLVRRLSTANPANNVPDRTVLVILPEVHLDSNRTWAYVIGEWQSTLPVSR